MKKQLKNYIALVYYRLFAKDLAKDLLPKTEEPKPGMIVMFGYGNKYLFVGDGYYKPVTIAEVNNKYRNRDQLFIPAKINPLLEKALKRKAA